MKGAKNAALKAVAAALLSREKWTITNFPCIEDTSRMLEIVEDLGVKVNRGGDRVEIQAGEISENKLNNELSRKLRASIMLAGPILARTGEVEMPYPGGCVIGKRPIDMFIDGFQRLGAEVEWKDSYFVLRAKKLKGARIFFPKISVTATESMMMTSVLAEGETVLENAAMEPEVPALADFLNKIGADISGAGTPTIKINGVKEIGGGKFEMIPDRIEAGTFVIMGILTGGEIKITKCNPGHIKAMLAVLEKTGADFETKQGEILVRSGKEIKAVRYITTHEYPGLATDLQAPLTLLMTQAKGLSLIHDSIFEGRLFFTDILNTMGADIIMCDPHRVVVNGPAKLCARKIVSPDLRAGITLVLAGLIAKGETRIENIYQIDRGYERIEERLQRLGAEIKRVEA